MKRRIFSYSLLTTLLIAATGETILCKAVFAQDTTKVKFRLQYIEGRRQHFSFNSSQSNFASDNFGYIGFIGTKPIPINYKLSSYSHWDMAVPLRSSSYLIRRTYRSVFYDGLPEYYFQRDESRRLLGTGGNTYIFFHP